MKLMRLTLLMSAMISSSMIHTMEDNKSEDSLEAIFKKLREIALTSQNPDILQKIQEYEEIKALHDEKYARINAWVAQCADGNPTKGKKSK